MAIPRLEVDIGQFRGVRDELSSENRMLLSIDGLAT